MKKELFVDLTDYSIKQEDLEHGELFVTIRFQSMSSRHFLADKYAEALRKISEIVRELDDQGSNLAASDLM